MCIYVQTGGAYNILYNMYITYLAVEKKKTRAASIRFL